MNRCTDIQTDICKYGQWKHHMTPGQRKHHMTKANSLGLWRIKHVNIADCPTTQICYTGWLGWAMVPGSFQCWGVLLLLHIVGQGPAVLVAGAGRVDYIFYIFHLSSLSNVLSFGRQLNMTEILWFWLLNPNSICQLLPRTSSLSTG